MKPDLKAADPVQQSRASTTPVARTTAMTSAQLGLLSESLLSGKPALNLLQVAVHFPDTVDLGEMQRAWAHVTAHQACLRMVLAPLAEDGPAQTVLSHRDTDVAMADLGPGGLAGWLETDRHKGIDPLHRPWRVRLLNPPGAGTVMVWSFHHALLDGSGYRLILRELLATLDASRAGSPLPVLASEGDGFPNHCRALAQLDHEPARSYFRDHLAGFDSPNEIPFAFWPGPASRADPQERRIITGALSPELSDRLRDRLRPTGAGMGEAVALAWGMVLGRCTGREAAVIGVTRSGRYLLPGDRNTAGCMINTLPCRVALDAGSVDSALAAQRQWTLAIRPFEHTPLSEIARISDMPSDRPLFDTILMFERASLAQAMSDTGLRVEEHSQMAAQVTLAVSDDPGICWRLEYDPARISDQGAERLSGYFGRLLAALADPANSDLGRLNMLPDDEEAALAALSLPDHPVSGASPILDRLRATCAARPEAIAVRQIGSDQHLSFRALDRRSNHIASQLAGHGIGPGDIVALCMTRSPDYVLALVAVLKTGAAFLPLDPAHPPDLRRDLLDRSRAVALITDAGGVGMQSASQIPVLTLNDPAIDGFADAPPHWLADPALPAYVIFTSGSTGRPKGVAIPHRAIAAHCDAMIRSLDLTPADRVLQFTSLSFDVSIEEILPGLLAGATVVLRDDDMLNSASGFLDSVAHEGITLANLPTAYWSVLVSHCAEADVPPALPPALRLMVVGGERIPGQALGRWRALYPDLRWMNGYGPTETTITASLFEAPAGPWPPADAPSATVPIGRPAGHSRLHVLAADGSLAPIGVSGELWIGGDGVGLGYLHQPAETATAFCPAPVAGPGQFYRSGDRACWSPSGLIEFRGRMDRQIKLRGFRIEPSAIEAALEADPRVAEAVVALDRAGSEAARLLAWVRPQTSAKGTDDGESPASRTALAAELAQRLGQNLPAHMIPQITVIDTFPQTPGGKVDTRALPRPGHGPELAGRDPLIAPEGSTAARIAELFAHLLQQENVAADASFFDLGGNSILAVRLISRIERVFGRRLDLPVLYRAPTPLGLSKELDRPGDTAGLPDALVPLQAEGRDPPFYAIHILGPNAAFFRPLAEGLGRQQPFYGLTFDLLAPGAPTRLEDIAAVYRANIDRHQPQGPVRLIAVSQGGYIAFELARQLVASGREVAGLYMVDADGPGGRPRRARRRGLGYYLRRLATNFGGVLRGQIRRVGIETGFHLTRLRVRLSRRMAPALMPAAHSSAAHQAAIDLAISGYTPRSYSGEIIVLRADDDRRDTPEAISRALGWSNFGDRGVRLIDTPGNHLTMLQEPNVTELASALKGLIARETPR